VLFHRLFHLYCFCLFLARLYICPEKEVILVFIISIHNTGKLSLLKSRSLTRFAEERLCVLIASGLAGLCAQVSPLRLIGLCRIMV
jgi:hypothetical protein